MMEKEWYVSIDGKQEGPYTSLELKRHPFVTPDTLIWKQGFKEWVAIRFVPELQDIFKDDPESKTLPEILKPKKPQTENAKPDLETLTLQTDPNQFYFWLAIFVVAFYFLYQYFRYWG